MFIQNRWYAVAWDHEIKHAPFGRMICGEKIVFYRKPDRSVVALEDCCPHRLLPLSKGKVEGERLVCGYHGIAFAEGGKCVHMPNQESINPNTDIRAYPVTERYRFVWVWIGDPALADEAKLPNMPWCEDDGWAFDGGTYHIGCDYKLLIDNLMDLTHETYVHPSSIGQEEITETPIETKSDGESVTVSRWMHDIAPPPFWAHNLRSTANCDRWQICRFELPANVFIDVGVALAGTGAPEGDRSQGVSATVVDLMTPETETTTWYHWGFARDFEVKDQGLTLRIKEGQGKIFAEDLDVLEEQQRNIIARPDRKLLTFNIDAGGVRARRIIERVLDAQAGSDAAE
ncbi:MAG: Rieske (2Fe-2S) protein [Hyphomicrobiales bacterium]|nr:MAG: Rieske (2Fe-2S) protein [Hyphomicrobiales bacterium]